jgi:phosphoglycolate phosphatase-like HAD superfamily hydrolase
VAQDLLTAPRVRPTTDNGSVDSLLDAEVAETPLLLLERDSTSTGLEDDEEVEPLSRHFYLTLPRHSHPPVRDLLERTEMTLRALHRHSKKVQVDHLNDAKEAGMRHEVIYANTYVDLGKINVIGFDFDYTLVTYTEQLLELIYDMALNRLVEGRQYPAEMLRSKKLRFDPLFSIRGLAVDLKTGWITHLSYTHKVAVAWEGREKLPTSRIFEEYRGKRALRPSERRQRLKPLNDLFSMAECCLIADTIQFFKDHAIPYCPQSVVQDVLKVVTETHLSGDFHRIVAKDPGKFFSPTPHLESVLENLKASGKKLIFVSNSPYWYVDAGMRYVFGKYKRQRRGVMRRSTR